MSRHRLLSTRLPASFTGLLLASLGFAAQAQQAPAPMPAQPASTPAAPTRPDCSNLPPPLAKVAADWNRPAKNLPALANTKGNAPVAAGSKAKLTLLPSASVVLPMKPEEPEKVGDFSGLVSFRTGKEGAYRFSTSAYVWIEVVPAAPPAAPAGVLNSDKRLHCADIAKNISFELSGNSRYWLQVSGARHPELDVLISAPE